MGTSELNKPPVLDRDNRIRPERDVEFGSAAVTGYDTEAMKENIERTIAKWDWAIDEISRKYADWSLEIPAGESTLRGLIAQMDPEAVEKDADGRIVRARLRFPLYKKMVQMAHAAYGLVDPELLESQLTGFPEHDSKLIAAALETGARAYSDLPEEPDAARQA